MDVVKWTLLLDLVVCLCSLHAIFAQGQAICSFSTPRKRVLELNDTIPVGSRVLSLPYRPASATISSVSISGDLGDFYKQKFTHRLVNGSEDGTMLELYVNRSLELPRYPSQITSASLRAQVLCNGGQYPIIVLQIKAANRYAPWFYGEPYTVNVSEAVPVGSIIDVPVLAIDWDPSPFYTVTYDLIGGNEAGTFQLEQSQSVAVNPHNLPVDTGTAWSASQLPRLIQFRLMKSLDYDNGMRRFKLNVSASDNGGAMADSNPRKNWTTVIVEITDSNDLGPVFDSRTYRGVVKQGAPAGTSIPVLPSIRAVDRDKEFGSRIKYSLENDRWISNYISIDPDSGLITLRDSLPSNVTSNFDVFVKAEEVDAPSHFATAVIRVSVSPRSDHALPEFLQCTTNVSIPEKAEYGSFVARVSAVDMDENPSGLFTYELVDKLEAEPFYLGSQSGMLTVVKPHLLDRNVKQTYHIQVDSVPKRTPEKSVSLCPVATVNVHLLEDDGSLRFSSSLYNFSIPGPTSTGSVIGWVHVINSDTAEDESVTIDLDKNTDHTCPFNIRLNRFDNASAQIVLNRRLDAGADTQCTFPLKATFHGSLEKTDAVRSRVLITINNDSAQQRPRSTNSHNVTIPGNAHAGSVVLQADSLFDIKDNSTKYFYFLNDTSKTFAINLTTGWITVGNVDNIRLGRSSFSLQVARIPSGILSNRDSAQIIDLVINVNESEKTAVLVEDNQATTIADDEGSVAADDQTTTEDDHPPTTTVDIETTIIEENQATTTADAQPITTADDQFSMVSDNVATNSPRNGYFLFKINKTLPVGSVVGQISGKDAKEAEPGLVRFITVSAPPYFGLSEDGIITLDEPLPDKTTSIYNIVYQAHNHGANESKQSFTLGTVHIVVAGWVSRDEQNAPRLTNLPNVVAVSESLPVGSAVYAITVSVPPSIDQLISIVGGNTNNTFTMGGSSVFVAKPLDAETANLYELRIQFSISGQVRAVDTLTIQVLDVNDNRPIFEKTSYEFSMNSSSITPNYIVGTVKANDADISSPSGDVFYELEGNGFGVFNIESTNGDIRALAPARRNYSDTYRLSVLAKDRGQPPLQDNVVVTIHVLDVTSSSPVVPATRTELPKFTQLQYSVAIAENSAPGDIVQVAATHPTHQLRYDLINSSDSFSIDPITGRVSTTGLLDYERTPLRQFLVSACVSENSTSLPSGTTNSTDQCSFASVFVNVLDENDNAPLFDHLEYVARLPKDAVVGSSVIRVHATDNDTDGNGEISYALKTESTLFAINPENGLIKTISANLEMKSYDLTIVAFDHGRPSLKGETAVKIIVNGTDPHAPEFERFIYEATISENADNGTVLVQVKAIDPDAGDTGLISYVLPPNYDGAEEEPFQIDSTSGEVLLAGTLDYEKRNSYQLMVEAVDHADPSRSGTTLVVITVEDVNDNPPVFDPIPDRIFISTSKEPSSAIFHLRATDRDSVSSGGGSGSIRFSIDPSSSLFDIENGVLKTTGKLESGEYNITLVATDGGDPPLSTTHTLMVIVMADSQLYPVFPQLSYEFNVKRNETLPEIIHTFQAVVKEGGIEYTLIPDTIRGILLDQEKGSITVTPELIDNVTTDVPIYLIVRATNTDDNNYFSDVSVIITVTNHVGPRVPLLFPSALYRGSVQENAPAGTYANLTINVMEADAFGDKLVYWLVPNDTLTVDSSGRILIVQPTDLEGLPATANGMISVQAFASNGSSVVSTIVQVKVVDVDEFDPHFSQSIYDVMVSEGIAPGEIILKLEATDEDYNDRILRYELANYDSSAYVSINSDGVMVKSDRTPFDREMNDTVSVTVAVYDQENRKATAVVLIDLIDVNDNPPQFVGLPYVWNATEGSEGVGQKFIITAVDADEGLNAEVSFRILQGNSEGHFLVSQPNGTKAELSIIKPLDREEKSQILLIVEVRDHGASPLFSIGTVTVNVIDVNDNAPKFFNTAYEQRISADFPLGFPIVTVYAQDIDLASNLTYSLVPGSSQSGNDSSTDYFMIKPESGQIVLIKSLPLVNQSYEFKTEVTDGSLKDEASVTINVIWTKGPVISVINITVPPQRVPPQFDQGAYNFSIPENVESAIVGRVGVVVGAGVQNVTNATQLTIEPDMFRNYFQIDTQGVIYNTQKLTPNDRDLVQPIAFFVSATDSGDPPLKTYAPVTVTVLDENDHTPVFTQNDYVGLVPAGETANYTVVLDIRAADDDVGLNSKIRYSLTGIDTSCFAIDPDTALVVFTCNPDYYTKNMYNLQVVATDRYGEGNSTTASLTILVVPPVDVGTEFPTPPAWISSNGVSNVTSRPAIDSHSLVTSRPGAISHSMTTATISSHWTASSSTVDRHPTTSPNSFFNSTSGFTSILNSNSLAISPSIAPVSSTPADNINATRPRLSPSSTLRPSSMTAFDALVNVPSRTSRGPSTRRPLSPTLVTTISSLFVTASANPSLPGEDIELSTSPVITSPSSSRHPDYDYVEFSTPPSSFTISTSSDTNNDSITVSGLSTDSSPANTPQSVETPPATSGNVHGSSAFTIPPVPLGTSTPNLTITSRLRGSTLRLSTSTTPSAGSRPGSPGSSPGMDISTPELAPPTPELTPPTPESDVPNPDLDLSTPDLAFSTSPSAGATSPPTSSIFPAFPTFPIVPISQSPSTADHCDSIEFPSDVDDIALSERTPLMTPVYVASAKPPSSHRRLLCYVVYGVSGSGSEYFDLNKENGLMKVARELDISTMADEHLFPDTNANNTLLLNLTASLADNGFSTSMLLRVRIERADEPIVASRGEIRFEHRSYSFSVLEQQPPGTSVGEIRAIANETGGSPTYTVLSAADTFRFSDPNNGTILTSVLIDYDNPVKSYSFVIQASDGGRNDYASVTVDVVDINNHAPTFARTVYEFQIPEGPYSTGAIVGDVEAIDKDSGVNALINYTIVESDSPFRVESSGRLYAFGEIDREQRDHYTFHVMAEDGGTPPMSSNISINVTVLDVNDNSPVFDNFTETVRVPEGTGDLAIITQLRAHDDDDGLNGHVIYRLGATDAFIVDQEGAIRAVTALSAGKQREYNLLVTASDLGRPARSTSLNMTILVEGNPVGPHFPQEAYYQDVPTNVSVGTPIIRMSAGNDSLSYTITGGNEKRLFSINEATGDISFVKSPTPGGYTVTVTATNTTSGQSATAVVRFFVYAPQNGSTGQQQNRAFSERVYSIEWPENTPGPAELTHMQSVYEQNNKRAKYEIIKGDSGKFRIEPDTGVVYVLDRLDRENQSMYIMVIRARPVAQGRRVRQADLLSSIYHLEYDDAILVVNVTDVNDNSPIFVDVPTTGVYTFTAPPGSGVRQMLGTVKAVDPDSSSVLRFEIVPNHDNDDSSSFRIDPDTGHLFTVKNLDSLEKTIFTIVVQASDGIYRSNTTVQVYKAAADKEVSMVSGVAPEIVSQYNHTLSKRLSELTGWTISVDKVSPVEEENTEERKSSLLSLSAFDRNRTISVDRDTLIKRLGDVLPTIQNDPKYSHLQLELSKEPTQLANTVQVISGPEIALIVISGVVILLALLGVLFLIRWWNKREKQKISAEYMLESNAHGKRPYEAETLDPRRRPEARRAQAKPLDTGASTSASNRRRVHDRSADEISTVARAHVVVIDSVSTSTDEEIEYRSHSWASLRT